MIWKRIQNEGTETNPRFKCMEEGFMDSIKSGWRKIKKAFADRPKVVLKGKNGEKESGYLHEYDKKNGTLVVILEKNKQSNENAVAAAVAASLAMRGGSGNGNGRNGNHQEEVKPKFKKGDKVEVLGAFLDTVQGEILGFETYADVAEYHVKILDDEVAMEDV